MSFINILMKIYLKSDMKKILITNQKNVVIYNNKYDSYEIVKSMLIIKYNNYKYTFFYYIDEDEKLIIKKYFLKN
jgi:hypothetical protein